MYGIYNDETVEKLVKMVQVIHSRQSLIEGLFAGQSEVAYEAYSQMHGQCSIQHYTINSMLYLHMIKDKYIKIYNEFISQLHLYAKAVRILAKGYLPILLITLLKLQEILDSVKKTLIKSNPEYNIVIKRLHLYYEMKLVTFGIDKKRNLIIQFLIFVQPYTQQPLILINNDVPIEIPSHPYILVNRSILCNCRIEAENNFLLESLAACHDSNTKLIMYFTINNAFANYLNEFNLMEELDVPIITNKSMSETTLPIFLNKSTFDDTLLSAPLTLKEYIAQYKLNKEFFFI